MMEPKEDNHEQAPSAPSRDDSMERDDGMKRLVKTALESEDPPGFDVLSGVQKRLRERSGGKFYADRWSTSRQPPVLTYLVTAGIMLVIVAVIYAVVSPLRGAARPVDGVPEPVQLLPPVPQTLPTRSAQPLSDPAHE